MAEPVSHSRSELASFDQLDWLAPNPDPADWSQEAAPTALYALEIEQALWRGFEDNALPWLEAIRDKGPARERAAAAWALARWHTDKGDRERALAAIKAFHSNPDSADSVPHPGPYLLAIQLLVMAADHKGAETVYRRGVERFGDSPDFAFAHLTIEQSKGACVSELSGILSKVYNGSDLAPVGFSQGAGDLFDRLECKATQGSVSSPQDQPLISVIVPVHNGERVLRKALSGLQAQTWQALEILVVDDGSHDDTVAIAQAASQADPRITVIALGANEGAYPARNEGFAAARGAFITVHDADDWSHPQKIDQQVRVLMQNPELKASVSHWVRASDAMEMTRWRIEEGWVFRNVSSLMVRAELREELGYWDRVRVNADTEYYYRILAAYGASAIQEVMPGVPLAFGRTLPQSLTSQSATHARTQYHGVRHDYMEAAHLWHARAAQSADPRSQLVLDKRPSTRTFCAPDAIALDPPAIHTEAIQELGTSTLFDDRWYLAAYPDVRQSNVGAARHYCLAGASEDRDPGPSFSTSGHRLACSLERATNPLLHALLANEQELGSALPTFKGNLPKPMDGAACAMVFAHTSGQTLFGAERSLVDMVKRLARDGLSPVVVLPTIRNPDYLDSLLAISVAVEMLPQAWRHGLFEPAKETIDGARRLIRKHSATEVHVNTVVLEAPLIAAREENVKSVLYVRELPGEDKALCRSLGMSAQSLREQLLRQADQFVMPSQVVADWLGVPARCTVRPNAVDEALFEVRFEPGEVLRVGLISSNIAKKGIKDAVEAARLVAQTGWPVHFILIGPRTEDIDRLVALPPNLLLRGYAATPVEAISQCDLVLSLSHFAESFGRTVVEAMAAGRPVICYDRGAPPSLVLAGKTGFVVPADTPHAVADAVLALDCARGELLKMSEAARERARELQRQALA